MRAINVTQVDLFSLDTEGNEWKVLKSLDLNSFDFKSIMIEYFPDEPKKERMKKYLEEKGFQFAFDNRFDIFYIKK